MTPFVALRYTGSVILIIGYVILLNVDVFWGVTLRMIANVFSLPWAIKNKVWDLVALLVLFFVIEVHKFLELIG
jgi:hypothetical protein